MAPPVYPVAMTDTVRRSIWVDRLIWALVFGTGVLAWGLLVGWSRDVLFGGGLFALLWATGYMLLFMRKVRRGEAKVSEGDEVDWMALGTVEIRIEGTKERYLANFTDAAVVESMDRHERRVARTMQVAGMPPAVVSTLDANAPTTMEIVELPRAIH
jgi:hypothetical protein